MPFSRSLVVCVTLLLVLAECSMVNLLDPPSVHKMVQLNARFKEDSGAESGNGTITTDKLVQGKIKINGQIFQAKCDCSPDAFTRAAQAKKDSCKKPEKYKVFYERKSNTKSAMKADDLLKYLGKPSDLKWVDAKAQPLSDIDGRSAGALLGTPGGEAGEFIIAFQVYEDMMGKTDSAHDAQRMLLSYLNATKPRRFPFYTTKAAVSALEDDLQETGINVAAPQDRLKEQLLGKKCADPGKPCGLLDAAAVGCDHLALMLKYPARYHVKPSLVTSFLEAFYTILWDEDQPLARQLQHTTLPAQRQEKAFLDVRVSAGCAAEGKLPLVYANKEAVEGDLKSTQSVFVRHPDAGAARRKELAAFFARQDPTHHIQEKAMLGRINQLATAAAEHTARQVAKDLPIYSVTVL